MKKLLTTIAGIPVYWDGKFMTFTAGMAIDADGAYRAYHHNDDVALDYLSNAGRPGNWWGVVTDTGKKTGKPVVQKSTDPAVGYFVSATAYKHSGFDRKDPRRYLDSENVIFAVVPPQLRRMVSPVVLGCRVWMRHKQTSVVARGVVGDVGPQTKLGEASIAAARALGIPSSPKNGGTSSKIIEYTLQPGETFPGFELKPA